MIDLLYDITELQPNLSDLSNFVYQVIIYHNVVAINTCISEPS